MIWTIALWLAMQAGSPFDSRGVTTAGNNNLQTVACVTLEQAAYYPYVPLCEPLAPAEHVFEIRATRETHGWSGYPIACDEGTEAELFNTGTPELWFRCVRTTRELWLDGKRLGIIKGLDSPRAQLTEGSWTR